RAVPWVGLVIAAAAAGAVLVWKSGVWKSERTLPRPIPPPQTETRKSETTSRKPTPAREQEKPASEKSTDASRKSIVVVAGEPANFRDWKKAAESGKRTFEHPGAFAYTIQLELACEDSTVAKALRSDPSGHRVWIAPYD